MVGGGKYKQKSCSFQEQSAGKNGSFYCYFHFLSPFCNLSAVSFCLYSTYIVACSMSSVVLSEQIGGLNAN